MSATIAPDDIVQTTADAQGNSRPPLLVLEPLRDFLDAHSLGSGEVEASPVGEGHSNVTYLIRRGATELVLRRPPRPPLPPSAHDVLREARLLRALRDTPARVPTVLAVCEDPAVIGSAFYVMEWIEGEVQLRRFTGLWEINKTREIPEVERVGSWLAQNLPESGPATIVHGDYRLGNTIFLPGAPARLAAVLDWEMATIGDPLADVGYLCMMWSEKGDPEGGLRQALGAITRREGFPARAGLIAAYEQCTGRSMRDLRWYMTLALWKSIVFMEGNYKRAIAGSTDDPYLKTFGDGVLELARQAEAASLDG